MISHPQDGFFTRSSLISIIVIMAVLGSTKALSGVVIHGDTSVFVQRVFELPVIIADALIEAYIAVSIFVALTLILVTGFERIFNFDIVAFNTHYPRAQVILASFLGALPGCGGAVIVLTNFVQKKTSFGSVVAALTATMGDAAFLLLAREPKTAAMIFVTSFIVGIISGIIIDFIHGKDYCQPTNYFNTEKREDHTIPPVYQFLRTFWWIILVPGAIIGIISAFQYDIDDVLGTTFPVGNTVGLLGAAISLFMWVIYPHNVGTEIDTACKRNSIWQRTETDTNFITLWVVMAFLTYEIIIHLFGLDLKLLFQTYAPLVPLVAILIGFIPGCGPQIIVTTMYLDGLIPLSAQLGNAISNDGDALFPAIAISPKAAIIATVYSAIPAMILAYGYYFFWEMS